MKKKYKPVALKVHLIIAELPKQFHIVCDIIGNPLAEMPTVNPNPPPYEPTRRYTQERRDKLHDIHKDFLQPAECNMMHNFMCNQEKGFAWTNSERG
jgi:hypothetical protein